MCKPDGFVESNVAVFRLVTKTDGEGVHASALIPEPDVSCTSARNTETHPIEAIDHRLIVVELPRRRDDRPLEAHESAGLPDATTIWLKVQESWHLYRCY